MTDIWGHLLGLSYGTTLGSEIAALFPERVEKVLLGQCQQALWSSALVA
jgi:pimeloyl-ACP methyl ester carboxylesterase